MGRLCKRVTEKRKLKAIMTGELYPEDSQAVADFENRNKIKPFGFHAIRHLSASVQYHKGKNLDWLQAFLRHQNATTTQRYLKSLGLEPLRKGLVEGFERSCEVFEFPKEKSL